MDGLKKDEYVSRIISQNIPEIFRIGNTSMYSFLEPFLIGNSVFSIYKGFPQISVPHRKNKAMLVGLFLQPIIINAGYMILLFFRSCMNIFKSHKYHTADLLFFSNDRFIDGAGTNPYFDGIITNLSAIRYQKICFGSFNLFSHKNNYLSVYDFLNLPLIFQIISKARIISRVLNEKNMLKFKDIFINDYAILEESIKFFFKILPLQISTELILTNTILKSIKPKVCCAVSETELFTKALIINAKKQNCKSCTLQFGEIIDDYSDLNPTNDIVPDYKFVRSEVERNILTRKYSYPFENVVVTGSPIYDSYSRKLNPSKIKKEMGIPDNQKVLIYFDQAIPEHSETICRLLDEAQKKFNLKIIIKLHPTSSNKNITQKYLELQACNDNVVILKLESGQNNQKLLQKLFSISDIVVTWYSTVAFEAILSHVPVIQFNLNKTFPDYLSYVDEGSSVEVTDETSFMISIGQILNNPVFVGWLLRNGQRSIANHIYKNDGCASKRIAAVIRSILYSSPVS